MIFTAIFTVIGLSLFETISSVDNAIINAEVLHTMGARAKRWFLTWGVLVAVFLVRGILPFAIIWSFNPKLSFMQVLGAAWSSDPLVRNSIEKSAPILLVAGGVFLLFYFCTGFSWKTKIWVYHEQRNSSCPREFGFTQSCRYCFLSFRGLRLGKVA